MSTVEEKRRYRKAFVNALYDMTEENPTLTFPTTVRWESRRCARDRPHLSSRVASRA
jgi:hypothetical protein